MSITHKLGVTLVFSLLAAVKLPASLQGQDPLADPNLDVAIAFEEVVEIQGRSFVLSVVEWDMEWPMGSGQVQRLTSLSIVGDERRISYHTTAGPFRPTVADSSIQFGGHSFTVTATPGQYLSDARPLTLSAEPRLFHIFKDGVYHGAQRF